MSNEKQQNEDPNTCNHKYEWWMPQVRPHLHRDVVCFYCHKCRNPKVFDKHHGESLRKAIAAGYDPYGL